MVDLPYTALDLDIEGYVGIAVGVVYEQVALPRKSICVDLTDFEARKPPASAERMNRLYVSPWTLARNIMYVARRESARRSLITECCRFPGVGPGVKHLPTKDLEKGAKTKHPQPKSISDAEAAGHTDSLNARGEVVRRFDMRRKPLRNENPAALADGSVNKTTLGPHLDADPALYAGIPSVWQAVARLASFRSGNRR
jgi:hypothetical protein